jgi:hypothetical protein
LALGATIRYGFLLDPRFTFPCNKGQFSNREASSSDGESQYIRLQHCSKSSYFRTISEPQLTNHECTALVNTFGEKTYHHTLPEGFSLSYFAQQQREVIPACVILPTSAEEVSQALSIIKDHQCHFAVKSGGHGMFSGASNAQHGITMDLRNLNSLQVSDDRLTTSVGTGTKWGEVYRELEPMNLTVSGGRDTQIGIGGFILGDE